MKQASHKWYCNSFIKDHAYAPFSSDQHIYIKKFTYSDFIIVLIDVDGTLITRYDKSKIDKSKIEKLKKGLDVFQYEGFKTNMTDFRDEYLL